jgi:putative PEP-CTERM system histidine kinase
VIYRLFESDGRHLSVKPVRAVIVILACIAALQPALFGFLALRGYSMPAALFSANALLSMLFAIGGLMLVHNLYSGASAGRRTALRWPTLALAALWTIDLNYYAIAYLTEDVPLLLAAGRGLIATLLAGLLAFGARPGSEELRFRPSRTVAFQSISLLLIGTYLLAMFVAAEWLGNAGGTLSLRFQIAFAAAATGLAVISLPSRRLRGWLRVILAKHLFQHRYDYREEWLRFTRTISREGGADCSLEQRVIKAIADIAESPAGLLLIPTDGGGMVLGARWSWPTADVPYEALSPASVLAFERDNFIVDLDEQRSPGPAQRADLPAWALTDPRIWAMVPLLHFERMVGMVVLARPPHVRRLDWEDFDLLRVAGQQLASYLAEHAGQAALAEVGRFDEFNRRIAFVMHDIKNLASQLGLLARNAEVHADNPEFRSDMLVTLRNSADKLNILLARLSRYGANGTDSVGVVRADLIAAKVVDQLKAVHHVQLVRTQECEVTGNAEPFEQALVHLVQNAIDASPDGSPVFVSLACDGMAGIIEVVDSGQGMSPEFVRGQLFKPFVSLKPGGFGIGAYEARELIRAMGGRLDVESREGLGTRFVIRLPLVSTAALLGNIARNEMKVA